MGMLDESQVKEKPWNGKWLETFIKYNPCFENQIDLQIEQEEQEQQEQQHESQADISEAEEPVTPMKKRK